MAAILPDEVRQTITTRIAAITPWSSYRRGTEVFAEASEPLVPEWEPATRAHLAFFVDDRDLEAIEVHGNDENGMLSEAPITVRILYQIRPALTTKITDWDDAGRCGSHVLGELLAEWPAMAEPIRPERRVLSRRPVGAGDWILVELRLRVVYTLSLALQA